MKKIILSGIAATAFAIAGGDITPVQEPMVETPSVMDEATDAGVYVGIGYGALKLAESYSFQNVTVDLEDENFDQVLLMAGYKINQYIAIEGRYWAGMSTQDDVYGVFNGVLYSESAEMNAFGIYAKPMYPVTAEFNVYALLGYANSTYDETYKVNGVDISVSEDLDGFSWGIGASYSFNESLSMFADYTVLYDDTYEFEGDYAGATSDFTISTVNVGVSYKF